MSTALTDTSKLNLSFKKVLGKAQTSNTKEVSNEGIGSNISIGASTIFGYEPPTPASSSYYTILGGVAEMVKLVATPMAGTKDSNGRYQAFALSLPTDYQVSSSNPNKGTGFYVNGQVLNETTGTLQIIPPSFGANYTALVYHTSSSPTQIPALDARDWVLDYFNGIFFQQDPPSDSDENPAYVNAFIYIGDYAETRLTGSGGAPGGSTTEVQFNNASSFGGSSNLTFNGTTLTGSYTGSLAQLTTLSASFVNFAPISGTMAGLGSYLALDSSNNVILATGDGSTTSPAGANTQLQFNNAGSFGASANLTYNSSTDLVALSGTMAISASNNTVVPFRIDNAQSAAKGPILFTTGSRGSDGAAVQSVGIGTDDPQYALDVRGHISIGSMGGAYIMVHNDPDTHIRFGSAGSDSIRFTAGNINFLEVDENGRDWIVFNSASADVDFQVRTQANTASLYVEGSTDRVGIGTSAPTHTLTTAGNTHLSGGLVHKHTTVAANYTASASDYVLGVTTTPVSIELNASSFAGGQVLLVKDESGTAAVASTITLAPPGGQTIDGAATATLESPYGAVFVYTNGSNWFIY